MPRYVRVRELLVGIEGLALLRELFSGSDESAQRRIDEVKQLVGDAEAERYARGAVTPELEVTEGYARWSTTYDAPGNSLVSAEQAVMWELLDAVPPGRALDAACGTGRHAQRLAHNGHDVTGIDATAEMLARAAEKVPAGRFQTGDLMALPSPDRSFDLVVCALALDHVADLAGAVAELARVLAPGGELLISDLHPVIRAIGAAAFFRDAQGASAFVRGHPHSHADYLDAFAAAGLTVRRCIEPTFGAAEVKMQQPAWSLLPDATTAAYLGLPLALIWQLTPSA